MTTRAEQPTPSGARGARLSVITGTSPPDLQPRLQSVLAALAEIDFEYESDLDTIRASAAENWLKQTAMRRLQERHWQRRAPYLRQLEGLERRIRSVAA